MWADHADAISDLYAGTGALKTDFTRTGKRTFAGLLQDGWRSVKRYMINNLQDGHNQDAWDLFTGRYVVTGARVLPHAHPVGVACLVSTRSADTHN